MKLFSMKLGAAAASLLALVASGALGGCGDDSGTGGTGGQGGGGGQPGGGGGGGGATTITLSGDFTSWPTMAPMAGADVCWRDAQGDLCTMTDAQGHMSLSDVPAGANGAITVDGADVIPTVLPIVLGDQDLDVAYGLDSLGFLDGLYMDAGLVADPTLGMVAIQTSDGGGTTIGLTPAGWEGPYYLDSIAAGFDLAATESSSIGVAYFMQVDPSAGPFTVQAAKGGAPCQIAEYGTALPTLEVFAGKQSHVRVHCNP